MKPELIPFGFLPVNKPVGPTSHDIVARLRRLLPKDVKVGHTGTLDPFASGVMILAVGKATRFADDVHLLPKSYRAEIRLGVQTNTLDPTGVVDLELPVPAFEQTDLDRIAAEMTGAQEQLPPSFSAKRVDGRKSYELARRNIAVELKPSTIEIFKLDLKKVDDHTVACEVHCSTGTYVRSLGRDVADRLGTCGHLTTLERTSVGPITLQDCASADPGAALLSLLTPVSRLLPQFPEVALDLTTGQELLQGRAVPSTEPFPNQFLGVVRHEDQTVAIFRCGFDPETGLLVSKHQCYHHPLEVSP